MTGTILVGDVGGTHMRFALAEPAGGDWRFARLEQRPTSPDVVAALARYLESWEMHLPGVPLFIQQSNGGFFPAARLR